MTKRIYHTLSIYRETPHKVRFFQAILSFTLRRKALVRFSSFSFHSPSLSIALSRDGETEKEYLFRSERIFYRAFSLPRMSFPKKKITLSQTTTRSSHPAEKKDENERSACVRFDKGGIDSDFGIR